jgi:hypothetical protein
VNNVLSVLPAAAQTPHRHDHSFSGAEHWAKVFDDPQRNAWKQPHEKLACQSTFSFCFGTSSI